MYGQGAGTTTTTTGVALLPETGNNRALFVLAVSLLVIGVAIFTISTIVSRKHRQSEAN